MNESTQTAPAITVKKTPAKKVNGKKNGKKATAKNLTDGFNKEAFMDSPAAQKLGFKKAMQYWADNGARGKKRGFRNAFYDACKKNDAMCDESKAVAFAKANGASDNDIKHIKHYVTIALLVADVRKPAKKQKSAPAKVSAAAG